MSDLRFTNCEKHQVRRCVVCMREQTGGGHSPIPVTPAVPNFPNNGVPDDSPLDLTPEARAGLFSPDPPFEIRAKDSPQISNDPIVAASLEFAAACAAHQVTITDLGKHRQQLDHLVREEQILREARLNAQKKLAKLVAEAQ